MTTLADVIQRNTEVTSLQQNVFFVADQQPDAGTDRPDHGMRPDPGIGLPPTDRPDRPPRLPGANGTTGAGGGNNDGVGNQPDRPGDRGPRGERPRRESRAGALAGEAATDAELSLNEFTAAVDLVLADFGLPDTV